MNVRWVKFPRGSWHIVLTPTGWVLTRYRTVCGRTADGPDQDERGEGRSCESCLRWLAKRVDV